MEFEIVLEGGVDINVVKAVIAEVAQALPKDARNTSREQKEVALCDKLFHLDKQWQHLPPEERQCKRLEKLRPAMENFFNWTDKRGEALHIQSPRLFHLARG